MFLILFENKTLTAMKTILSLIFFVSLSNIALAQSSVKASQVSKETDLMNVSTVRENAEANAVFAFNDQPSEVKTATSDLSTQSASTMSLYLVNTSGKVIMQQELTASNSAIEVKLPKTLPAGLYLVKVKGCPEAETQKFSIH
jgi:ethanolamine utilization microcompartment shell protein EutS